jgi:transposase
LEAGSVIQVTPQMRILVCVEPADFRKGIDGLCRICRQEFHQDPFSGYVFVFRNRKATAIKILVYDGQGFWLCQKRMSKDKFYGWPISTSKQKILESYQLPVLLSGGDPIAAPGSLPWRRINSDKP